MQNKSLMVFKLIILIVIVSLLSCVSTNEYIVKSEVKGLVLDLLNNPETIKNIVEKYPQHFDDKISISIVSNNSSKFKILSDFKKINADIDFYEIHFDKYSFKEYNKDKRIPEDKNTEKYLVFLASKKYEDGVSFYFMVDSSNNYILFDIKSFDLMMKYKI